MNCLKKKKITRQDNHFTVKDCATNNEGGSSEDKLCTALKAGGRF